MQSFYARVISRAWSDTRSFTLSQGLVASAFAAAFGNVVYYWIEDDVRVFPILVGALGGIGLLVVLWFTLQLLLAPARVFNEVVSENSNLASEVGVSKRFVADQRSQNDELLAALEAERVESRERLERRQESLLLRHVIANLEVCAWQLEQLFESIGRAVNRQQVEGTGHEIGAVEALVRHELREHADLFALYKSNMGLVTTSPHSDVQDQKAYLDDVQRRSMRLAEIVTTLTRRLEAMST